jgi:hypothetical protein
MAHSNDDYGYEPEYGGLSNHLPMAVRALQALGADTARVAEFRASYSPRLSRLDTSPSAAPIVLQEALGRRRDFPALLRLFGGDVTQLGASAAVRKWLPVLMPGVAAAAFHPLIMLYYALDAQDDRGVGYALAYFAWSYLPLLREGPAASQGSLSVKDAASRLTGMAKGTATGLIFERLAAEARRPEVESVIELLGPEHDHADTIALVTATHQRVNDFGSLHMVTSWHAYRRIGELADFDVTTENVHLSRALLVAYVATGAKPLAPLPSCTRSWGEMIALARQDPDEHVIKLVWTCFDMHERWQVDARVLAERAVKLPPS